jgi:hypothetical protein
MLFDILTVLWRAPRLFGLGAALRAPSAWCPKMPEDARSKKIAGTECPKMSGNVRSEKIVSFAQRN